jgi:glycosyltransferase involved in cell wall biosynthesis
MSLSIDLYCNDGSPMHITPPDIFGRGVGGAELAMMTWAEVMAGRGHKVRVYNNPNREASYNGVAYLPQSAFGWRDERDVFIAYRSPNRYTRTCRAAVKLFWSTDQQTVGNFATDVFPYVDRVVCISPFHVDYHLKRYWPEYEAFLGNHAELSQESLDTKVGYFDLGVRVEEYDQEIEKVPGRCIFCSVPERGLEVLRLMWPKIKERVPNASLVITSDYTLWGAPNPLNQEHRLNWLHHQDVDFMGKIPRAELVKEQLKAEVMPFSCSYEELFCISAAECQVAGAVPVTSGLGALPTTNQWGSVLKGNILDGAWQESFINEVYFYLASVSTIRKMKDESRARFDWNIICEQWEQLIATGEFVTKEPERVTA